LEAVQLHIHEPVATEMMPSCFRRVGRKLELNSSKKSSKLTRNGISTSSAIMSFSPS
jgi:hypothetical protein